VEQCPYTDQFSVHRTLDSLGNGNGHDSNFLAVSNNIRRAAGLDQEINFTHKPLNNTIIL